MKNLYKFSKSEAKRNGELKEYRESFNENIYCRDFLDDQLNQKFDGMHLSTECVESAVKEFGYDRTMWVIANTVLERDGDSRFHRENREWANKVGIPEGDRNYEFALRSHSCKVDILADQVRKMYGALNFFGNEHIEKPEEPQDYKEKLLVIRAEVLKEEYRTPENQLFFASGGFGCSPTASGRKVYGEFLSDGEKTHFYREDFVGVLANEHTPDWAKEKITQIQQRKETEGKAKAAQSEEAVSDEQNQQTEIIVVTEAEADEESFEPEM